MPYFASDVFLTQWQAVDALAQQNGADGIKQKDVAKQLGKQPVAVPSGLPDSIYRQNISGTPAKGRPRRDHGVRTRGRTTAWRPRSRPPAS
ncbi:hypothetical protein GCM10020229_70470 [Kitasatospora albolonga]|uniref:hypothetical protein n=1 Tax=Kitasatospora albolonga TaxID=68173 RepID=UPI0031EC1B61